jgi:LPXTG-site transpeptidase (sortase) family protein
MDTKKIEEQEVWQNPRGFPKRQAIEEPVAEKPVEEKQIIEELAKIKAAKLVEESKEAEEPKEAKATEEKRESSPTMGKTMRKPSNLGTFIRWLGNFLIIASVLGLIFTFWPIAAAEISYRVEKLKGIRFTVDRSQMDQITDEKVTFGDLLGKGSPKILVPKSTDFGIIVEKIAANAPVIANVDAANPKEYNQKLQKGVAHAKGTVFPGQKGLSYLFAHSTLNPWDVPRYNAVFYLLREIEAGDRVVIFYKNVRYDYFVTEKKIVAPNDVSIFRENFQEPILVLQTCDPPGTTWRRLLVIAKMKSS